MGNTSNTRTRKGKHKRSRTHKRSRRPFYCKYCSKCKHCHSKKRHCKHCKGKKRKRSYRGGSKPYFTSGYSSPGTRSLRGYQSALANPPPYTKY